MDSAKINKNTVVIALGGNLGNRLYFLHAAERMMAAHFGEAVKRSSIYETPAWGLKDQAAFLNSVLVFETTYEPQEVLKILRKIEKDLGRVRYIKWGPRIIDLDILYYNSAIIDSKELKVPHPFLQERSFVLIPLSEVLPEMVHPLIGKSNQALLAALKEKQAPTTFVKEDVS